MKQRALSLDDKAIRRTDILNAARQLFLEDSRQLPSAARIAQAAGLAKGTVYLYFRTKEEIFISLLEEDFSGLLQTVYTSLEEHSEPKGLAGLIGSIAAYINQHPEMLRLDAMSYSVLEQNLNDAQLRSFKLNLTNGLVFVGARLDEVLGQPAGRGVSLLMRTYALIRGLWQSLDHPPSMRAILADPIFAPIRPDFQIELVAALNEYWRGALADITKT
jgi:AcrR family transcriptional regulator